MSSEMKTNDLLNVGVIGDLFLDIQANGLKQLPQYDKDNLVESICFIPGGSAANTARQLAIFPNIECNLLSTAGDDSLCDTILNYVKNEKCNFSYIKRIKNVPTASCIVLCAANTGNRGYVTCNGSLNKLDHNILIENEEQLIHKLCHLHIGGFFNTFCLHSDQFIDTLKIFKNKYKALTYSLDSNSISIDTDPTPYFMKLIPLLDVLFLNKNELIEILTIVHKNMDKQYDENTNIETLMNDLIVIGKNNKLIIVLKMGKNGSLVRMKNGKIIQCQIGDIKLKMFHETMDKKDDETKYQDLNVIDSTGAGDSFNAGFLGQWLLNNKNNKNNNDNEEEEQYLDCLYSANSCGAIRCTMIGGCSKPITFDSITRFKQQLRKHLHSD